jgi:hypothetical protein
VSNLSDLLDDITSSDTDAVSLLGDALGTAADISGGIGFVTSVMGLLTGGADPTKQALQNILDTVQKDFAELGANDKANNIIQTYRELDDNVTSAAQTQLVQLQAHMAPQIAPCVQTIEQLALNDGAIQAHWWAVYDWQIFWTDAGEYFQKSVPFPSIPVMVDAGYGPQTPPQVGNDLVFSYRYVLPDLLRMVAIFIAVAGTVDPSWVADYESPILKPLATFLKTQIHDTILSGITQLSPGYWDGQSLWNMLAVSPRHWPGVSQLPPPDPILHLPPAGFITGANLEFGAVEKYSGCSSMGNYQISFQDIPMNSTDPSPYNKFQIRLLKRAIDVYVGVGLLKVWKVINSLNALVGAPPMPMARYARWSFREIAAILMAPAPPPTVPISLLNLARILINTPPSDTPAAGGVISPGFRSLLGGNES